MTITFHMEKYPVVYIQLCQPTMTNEVYEEYQKRYLQLLLECKMKNEKISVIYDVKTDIKEDLFESVSVAESSNLGRFPYMMKQMQFMKQIADHQKAYVNCVIIICENFHIRNILKMMSTIMSKPCPFKISSGLEKSCKYLKNNFNINVKPTDFQR